MRDVRPPALALILAFILALACAPCAQAGKPAAKADSAQARGEPVDISGRVAVGLDKTFIKDPSQGYLMVQGLDLSRFAGRHIQAKGLLLGQEQGYRVVRLLEFRVLSPDDDSPGAGGSVGQGPKAAPPARKKK